MFLTNLSKSARTVGAFKPYVEIKKQIPLKYINLFPIMKKLEFKKEIKAKATRVWDILWSESTYTQWTAAFNPKGISTIQSDWKVGGKTLFLDGQGNG